MKGLALDAVEETYKLEKSPMRSAITGGLKGAVLGGVGGALVSGLSGGSAATGGFIGGLLAAAAFGAGHALAQDVENKENESALRVHLSNLKEREPFFYMPPRPLFSRMLRDVR